METLGFYLDKQAAWVTTPASVQVGGTKHSGRAPVKYLRFTTVFAAFGLIAASFVAPALSPASAQSVSVTQDFLVVEDANNLAQLINSDDYRPNVDPEILRLYLAFFDREPDLEGIKYWIGVSQGVLDGNQYSTLEIARFFVDASTEFERTYADAPNNSVFLTRVYENVLGRQPDAAGFDYWLDILNGTNKTGGNPTNKVGDRGEVIYYVAVNQEFINSAPYVPGTGNSVLVKGIFGSEREVNAIQDALDAFTGGTEVHAKYVAEPQIEAALEAGTSDASIAIHSAGRSQRHMNVNRAFIPLPASSVAAKLASWPSPWRDMGDANSIRNTAPIFTIPKSLVWFRPGQFGANQYSIPRSVAELRALELKMIADGNIPYCVGIESGQSTGWVYTDEVEEDLLRISGPSIYDEWIDHDIAFTNVAVTSSMQRVVDNWNIPGMVFASGGTIGTTRFDQAVVDFENAECMMIRQASYAPQYMSDNAPLADGSVDEIDVFYNPTAQENHRPTSGSLQTVGALQDRPQVWSVLEYMIGRQFAEQWRIEMGADYVFYFSLAQGQDTTVYRPIEQRMFSIAEVTTVIRLDASDQFPPEVGAGTFWSEGTKLVEGDTTVALAASVIEASWPVKSS